MEGRRNIIYVRELLGWIAGDGQLGSNSTCLVSHLTGNLKIHMDDNGASQALLGARVARVYNDVAMRILALNEGTFDASTVTCPLHGSQFDVRTGAVLRGPAKNLLKTYCGTVDCEVGRFHVPLTLAVQSE